MTNNIKSTDMINTREEFIEFYLSPEVKEYIIDKNKYSTTSRAHNLSASDIEEIYVDVYIKLASSTIDFEPKTRMQSLNYFFTAFNTYYADSYSVDKRTHHGKINKGNIVTSVEDMNIYSDFNDSLDEVVENKKYAKLMRTLKKSYLTDDEIDILIDVSTSKTNLYIRQNHIDKAIWAIRSIACRSGEMATVKSIIDMIKEPHAKWFSEIKNKN